MDFTSILKKIKPTEKEKKEQQSIISEIEDKLKIFFPKYVKIKLTGSMAKRTQLKGNADFDFFLIYPREYELNFILSHCFRKLRKAFAKEEKQMLFANHPYIRILYKNKWIDFVPAFELKKGEKVKSAVDRTQLHTDYFNEKAGDDEKIRDEVRLFKFFLKQKNLYGAEAYIGGFSGYLTELFILLYGSFENAVRKISTYDKKQYLSLNGLRIKSDQFKDDCLVFIDPVDKERNVASPLSKTKLNRLIIECQRAVSKGFSNKIFEKNKVKIPNNELILIEKQLKNVNLDIDYPRLIRIGKKLVNELTMGGFEILSYSTHIVRNKGIYILEIASKTIPALYKVNGPDIYMKKGISNFISVHKHIYVSEKIYAVKKRKFVNIKNAIKEFFKSEKIKIRKPDKKEKILHYEKVLL